MHSAKGSISLPCLLAALLLAVSAQLSLLYAVRGYESEKDFLREQQLRLLCSSVLQAIGQEPRPAGKQLCYEGELQPDSEPVTVNEAMATEEILEKIPKEISIRTSKNNRNPATIVWDWEDAPEKNSDGESVLKGTAILPTGVENLGEITLEVSTKLLWEQPVLTEELKEQENGISAVVCVSAAAIVTAAVGIIVMMRKHKKTSQS